MLSVSDFTLLGVKSRHLDTNSNYVQLGRCFLLPEGVLGVNSGCQVCMVATFPQGAILLAFGEPLCVVHRRGSDYVCIYSV